MTKEVSRLIAYLAAVALGLFMAVWGILNDTDWALITAGAALVTTGTLAGVNVPGVRSGKYAAD